MTKSDYVYGITDGIIVIIDRNLGRMSVTNDIENVVETIMREKNLSQNTPVVYQDSMGIWDGWNHVTQNFIHIGANNLSVAIDTIKEKRSS